MTAPSAQLDGLVDGATLTSEPLFAHRTRMVVDASHCQKMVHDRRVVVPLDDIFARPDSVFVGFGVPNVFLTLPRSDGGGWEKYAATMFYRGRSRIADTRRKVQGGVFFELRGLETLQVERLRYAMVEHAGHRTMTCARANAEVLAAAGFTSGGEPFDEAVRPMHLARMLWCSGIELDGRPLDLRVIRTTTTSVSEHFAAVIRTEGTSPARLVRKVVKEKVTGRRKRPTLASTLSHAPTPAPLQAATQAPPKPPSPARAPARAPISSLLPFSAPMPAGSSDVAEPLAKPLDEQPRATLRASRPSRLGSLAWMVLGHHPIFEALHDPRRTDLDGGSFSDLEARLVAYPGKLDAVTKLKRYVLFAPPTVRFIRSQMAAEMDSHGEFPGPSLVDMLKMGDDEEPFLYSGILTGSGLKISRIDNRSDKDVARANWVLAKHVLLSGYDPDVRFAGEVWVTDSTEGRVLHVNNNSGTYKPSPAQTLAAAAFLRQAYGIPVEAHVVD